MLPSNSLTLLFATVLLVTVAVIQTQPEGQWRPTRWPEPTKRPTRWPEPPRNPCQPTWRPTRKPREAVRPTPRPCARSPQKCSAAGPPLCVRSRNGKLCRRLANKCALRKLNCQSKPRNNWSVVNKRCCATLKVGARAVKCRG